jgi:hypothetical protein
LKEIRFQNSIRTNLKVGANYKFAQILNLNKKINLKEENTNLSKFKKGTNFEIGTNFTI